MLVLVGVPPALPLIVLTWPAAFFPIVGAVPAGVAAVLVALVADGFVPAAIVAASVIVVQQLEGNVLLGHRREREERETAVTAPSAAERAVRARQRAWVGARGGHDI